MLNKILNQITKISDDDDINTENYMSALNYVDNAYKFLRMIGPSLAQLVDEPITYLPSYKDKYLVEKLGILSTASENELKCFKLKSKTFLYNEVVVDKLKNVCLCQGFAKTFTKDNDTIIIEIN